MVMLICAIRKYLGKPGVVRVDGGEKDVET